MRHGHGQTSKRRGRPPHRETADAAAGRAGLRRDASRRRAGASKTEVREGGRRRRAAPGGALDQPLLQQVGLVDVLDRVLLLAHRDRQRREADRAAGELPADRAEDLAVQAVKAPLVDLQQLQRAAAAAAPTIPSMRTSA